MASKFTGCLKKGTEGKLELWYDCVMKDWFWSGDEQASISYESQEKAEEVFIMEEIKWE